MLPDFRVRQRDYLLEISRALTQELDLEKLLARILRIAIEMLAGQAGIIALKEDGWRVAAAHGIAAAFLSYLTPLLAEENVRELNVNELNRMLKELTYTASMGLLNGTALPLAAHGQVIGVIFIFRNYTELFTPNDRVLLQSFDPLRTRRPLRSIMRVSTDRFPTKSSGSMPFSIRQPMESSFSTQITRLNAVTSPSKNFMASHATRS